MHDFVVLGLVFSIPSQETGLGKRLRNDLFCVEWDVKPQLNQSVNLTSATVGCFTCCKQVSLLWLPEVGLQRRHSAYGWAVTW